MANTFDRHDFSFKWSHGEFDAAHNLMPWAVSQVADAYEGIAKLVEPTREVLFSDRPEETAEHVGISEGDAARLPWADRSVHGVIVDPPYYDNVQYAELADFFYVWQKRTIGRLHPDLFQAELTNKDSEAVANPARFVQLDKKKARDLAKADYERKMTAAFREMDRVLMDEGVLTVMFTHKKVEAWDTLGRSLIEGGFVIESSWPVHTESEHSLHQAKKAAASSTILLTCRKRTTAGTEAWWDDLKDEVRRVAREKAEEFQGLGIAGVDLYISTFGPTLSVISRQWPVLTSDVDPETGDPLPLRPEEALDLAREEVASLRRQGLLLGRSVEFDAMTDWYLLAWDAFRAAEFPFDEARKLALALDVEPEALVAARLISKKSGTVVLQEPKLRRRKGLADPDATSFDRLIDAAHALMVVTSEDGIRGAEAFLKGTGLSSDARFRALLQALVNAIPRTKSKGAFVRPEAQALDAVAPLFPDLVIPEEVQPEDLPEQVSLLDDGLDEDADDE
jgi:putative DNA methylase